MGGYRITTTATLDKTKKKLILCSMIQVYL